MTTAAAATPTASTDAAPAAPDTRVPDRPHLTAAEQETLGAGLTDTNEDALAAEAAAAEAARVAAEAAAAEATAATAAAAEAEAARVASEAAAATETARQAAEAARVAAEAAAAAAPTAAPKDFAAEQATLKAAYNNAEMDVTEYMEKMNALSVEQSAYTATKATWEAQQSLLQTNAAAAATNVWNADADAWAKANPDFCSNADRVAAMKDNIAMIDKANPTLSNAALLAKAYAWTAAETGYTAPTKAAAPDPEAARAAAIKAATDARKANTSNLPPTLGTAPGGAIDAAASDSHAALDALPIDQLEYELARMPQAAVDAYLRGAPGATATGRE